MFSIADCTPERIASVAEARAIAISKSLYILYWEWYNKKCLKWEGIGRVADEWS